METEIVVGVSSCLLGQQVRYDGGHKRDAYVVDTLGAWFRYVAVCPEVECGMPVPREAIRLEGDPESPFLMGRVSREDMTGRMEAWSRTRLAQLADEELCGCILKKDSPSCGLKRVKVYREGFSVKSGSGIFAAALTRRFPQLPVEEEGRLNDSKLRENFIERVFACKRWKDFIAGRPRLGALVDFHTRHKLLLMAHEPRIYREMGKLVARGASLPLGELLDAYAAMFTAGLSHIATVRKHTDVLMHIMGYFKKELSHPEKEELLDAIGQYRRETAPLVVPLTLLRHYIMKYDQSYLKNQAYLNPHPRELMLRNHV